MTRNKPIPIAPATVIKSYVQIPKTTYRSHVMHVHLSDGRKFRQSIWRDIRGFLSNLGMECSPGPRNAYVHVYEVPDDVMAAFASLGPEVCQRLDIHPLRFYAGLSAQQRLPNLFNLKETKPR